MNRSVVVTLLSASLASLALAGCGAAAPHELVDARAAYHQAEELRASSLAPVELHVAEVALTRAEAEFQEEGDEPRVRDMSYIALRRAQIASTLSRRRMEQGRSRHAATEQQRLVNVQHARTEVALSTTRAQLQRQQVAAAATAAQLDAERQRREAAEARAQAALQRLADIASIRQESRGTVITLSGEVIFETGRAVLLSSALRRLDEVAQALADASVETEIVIEGHTDSRGTLESNQVLSQLRADAVRSYLITRGVSGTILRAVGMGESRPMADNGSAEGRATNRRVEIIVTPAAPTAAGGARAATP